MPGAKANGYRALGSASVRSSSAVGLAWIGEASKTLNCRSEADGIRKACDPAQAPLSLLLQPPGDARG